MSKERFDRNKKYPSINHITNIITGRESSRLKQSNALFIAAVLQGRAGQKTFAALVRLLKENQNSISSRKI